jgi:class 3 adenylate cyclase
MATELDELLKVLDRRVRDELADMPAVVDKGHDLDVTKLPIAKREWHRLAEAFAVVVDLKSSTQLDIGRYPASTASIYEAATGNAVMILGDYDADFIAIQGDGAFGLFWGANRFERAITAGITVKTFSQRHLVKRLDAKWPTLPETGFKVGVAASPLLVKRVGIPRTEHQEPVWAGKAVNYAAKAAQQADRHELVVTGSVWDQIAKNHYLSVSCPCNDGASTAIWTDVEIERLAEGNPERPGRLLTAMWCETHGSEYCAAVLSGQRVRDDVADLAKLALASQMKDLRQATAAKQREELRDQWNAWGSQ